MKLTDSSGKTLSEVTVRLNAGEVTELLVAASEIDDGTTDHNLVRDPQGSALALYVDRDQATPLERGMDWWTGPVLLLVAIFILVGIFTVAKGLVGLLF
jgi:hypothetical protein